MKPRFKDMNQAAHAMKAMLALQSAVDESGLEPDLVKLIQMRASQINGCAYCLNMHYQEAKAQGETDQRLFLLDAWRDAPMYTDRERAALEWTEAVTLITADHVSDEVYTLAREQFSEAELANLTLAVVAINGWNRFNIAFRNVPPVSRAASRATAQQPA